MSDSLSSPWLYSAFYDLLSQDVAEQPIKRANRTVQVLRVSVPFRTMTIHDRQHSCTVFLTQACFDRFMEEYSFSVLKHSFIKLRCYHFSTAVQAGGDRDMTAMLAEKQVTLPLAVHCDRFDYVTSGDFDTSGEPIDINTDPTIRAVIYKLKYRELSEKLSQRQFPFQLCLPAYDGQFNCPLPFGPQNPLELSYCHINPHEQAILKLLKISGPSELLSRQSDIRHKSSAELEAMLDNRDSSSTYEYSKRQQRTSTQVEDGTEVDPLEPWTLTDGSQDDLQDTLPDQSAGEGANLEGLRSSPESTPDAEYAERKMKIVRFRKVFNPYTNAGFVLSRGSAQRNGKVLSWDETQVDPDNEGIHRSSHTEIDGDNADQCDDQVVSKLLVELPVSTETFASGEAHPVDQSTDRTLSASSTSASSTSIAGNQLAIYSTAVSLSDVGSRSSQEHLTHDNMEDLQRWLNSTCQSKMGNSQILAPTPIFSPKITEGFSTDRSAVHTIDYSHGSEPKVVLINNNVTGVSHIELVGGRQPGERNQLLKESLQSFEGTPKRSSSSSKMDSQLLTQTGQSIHPSSSSPGEKAQEDIEPLAENSKSFIGERVQKHFSNGVTYGIIRSYRSNFYTVEYEDGFGEELHYKQLYKFIADAKKPVVEDEHEKQSISNSSGEEQPNSIDIEKEIITVSREKGSQTVRSVSPPAISTSKCPTSEVLTAKSNTPAFAPSRVVESSVIGSVSSPKPNRTRRYATRTSNGIAIVTEDIPTLNSDGINAQRERVHRYLDILMECCERLPSLIKRGNSHSEINYHAINATTSAGKRSQSSSQSSSLYFRPRPVDWSRTIPISNKSLDNTSNSNNILPSKRKEAQENYWSDTETATQPQYLDEDYSFFPAKKIHKK